MKNKTTPPTAPEAPAATIHADQLAGLCNLTRRRLYQLAEETKIPPATNGQFPMVESIRQLFAWYQRDGEQYDRERLLKLTAERKQEERRERIAAKVEQRDYIPTDEVVKIFEFLSKALENLPAKLESEHGLSPQVTRRIQQLLDEARESVVAFIQQLPSRDMAQK